MFDAALIQNVQPRDCAGSSKFQISCTNESKQGVKNLVCLLSLDIEAF